MSTSAVAPRRVFLRLKSSIALDEEQIVEQFLTHYGINKEGRQNHFIHIQPRDYRHFVIVIDMNYAQFPEVVIKELPHEVYLSSCKGDGTDL